MDTALNSVDSRQTRYRPAAVFTSHLTAIHAIHRQRCRPEPFRSPISCIHRAERIHGIPTLTPPPPQPPLPPASTAAASASQA